MAENSNIEWTDHTFNPWIGCQKVGPGCDNCYAETWDARGLQQSESRWGPHATRTRTSAANWRKPLAWDRAAAAEGVRKRVFCASLADVFDNHPSILPEWRADLWALIASTPNLDWMLLTKRPSNIAKYLPNDSKAPWYRPWNQCWPWPNVWIGCTVVNQAEADRDIPKLLEVPAAVRFLSMEPLQGPVDLTPWLDPDIFCEGCDDGDGYGNRCGRTDIPREQQCPWGRAVQIVTEHGPFGPDGEPHTVTCEVKKLDLVIVGGESGPKARPMHPDWVRGLRDQCNAANVAFHFKQWGEWGHAFNMSGVEAVSAAIAKSGHWAHPHRYRIHGGPHDGQCFVSLPENHLMLRVGKKAAGRMLDGRTWDEMPEALK